MKVGRYEVTTHNHGFFRLDGGAMFGVVPRTIWSKVAPPDEENRIRMATRSLLIEDGQRKVLVDLGCGDKWSAKSREIFGLADGPYQPVPGVSDVLLTHLHFDHAGGISRYQGGSQDLEPCYPGARHYVSRANYENALRPNVREKASYLAENVSALGLVDTVFTEDGRELWPGISVHQCHGHTHGLQWVKVTDGGTTVAFVTDICPTAGHLPLPFVLGYDMCAETSLRDRDSFFRQAVEGEWIVVFEHDPEIGAVRLAFDERGRAHIREHVQL
jgi:glyoxylase-like metal-dependent hydrolase (beta-lactamase superfamily II)